MNTETIVCADCTVMFTATLQNHEIVKGILENQGFIKESIFIHVNIKIVLRLTKVLFYS